VAGVADGTPGLPESQPTPPKVNVRRLEFLYGLGSRFIPFGALLGAAAIEGLRRGAAIIGTEGVSREGTMGLLNREGFVRHGAIEVSAKLAPFLEKLDAYASAQGGHISWTSGHRTPAQQSDLFRRWERGDPNVPFEPLPYEQSKHATGDAADGEASSTALALSLGEYARSLGMGWSPHEPWHFEV
jgi:hypothetical protein